MKKIEITKIYLRTELHYSLTRTRNEPGLSLREVAEIIKEVFTKEEVEALVKELKI